MAEEARRSDTAGYRPIKEYGIIGNMLSAALVSIDGSMDWCCLPRFDSPSVFAAILDSDKGGSFRIRPSGDFQTKQAYIPETNILQSFFETRTGSMTLTDFMPCFRKSGEIEASLEVHRQIACTKGTADIEVVFEPRLDYGRGKTDMEPSGHGIVARNGGETVTLASSVPLEIQNSRAKANFTLKTGETAHFILNHGSHAPSTAAEYHSAEKLEKTKEYWKSQAGGCSISGPWREHLVRSYLALHLLIYLPTGALLAAPTTSLPEVMGGEKNWDYRYSWLRDTSLALLAFGKLGHREEIDEFMNWLMKIRDTYGRKRQTLYSIGLDAKPEEEVLGHLIGYRGSRPVRIGNEAYKQNQLDVFGEVIETAYDFKRLGGHISREEWEVLADYIDHACRHWPDPDSGIWEIRGSQRHYVYSKLMCWVAIDRGIKLAKMLGYGGNWFYWEKNRRLIRKNLLKKGWKPERNAFTQHYDTDALDASNLLIPLYDFLPITDERARHTVELITSELGTGNGLLMRFTGDAGQKNEGAFLWCSFWLVRNYIRMGRLDDAVALYEKLLGHGNHLGLFPEMIDPDTGEALGNFPQALTHLAIIVAGLELAEEVRKREKEKTAKQKAA